ncbi:hypothetical protein BJ508DRAFT_416573 [Ascobolus immersus RN42]|uniref:F-box domain-containing protein n=1 Tax=Ascobolus immersus RN42 TaxID=1160509 RepID=A0A3N4HXC0_ASCIM|nr:hypothetical protein BJ508DRAFT_416573 [Ascobolus immersus RN42]
MPPPRNLSIFSLPPELRLDIFSQCTAFTLLQLSHTCRSIYYEINTHPSIYKTSFGYFNSSDEDREFKSIVLDLARRTSPVSPLDCGRAPLCALLISDLSSDREKDQFLERFGPGEEILRLRGVDNLPEWTFDMVPYNTMSCCDTCLRIKPLKSDFLQYYLELEEDENGQRTKSVCYHWNCVGCVAEDW